MTSESSISFEPVFDVVVVGGGIVGCAIAYHLALRRARVIVLEQANIAAQQSSRAWGFIRQQGRHSAEMPLAAKACRMWEHLEDELDADLEYIRSGILLTAETPEDEERLNTALKAARASGIKSDLIGSREISKLFPGERQEWVCGLFTPGDGHAEPVKASLAFAAAAKRLGVVFKENSPVMRLQRSASGNVSVVTADGVVRANQVVVAAGVGSAELMRGVGVSIPVQPVRASVAQTNPSNKRLSVPVWSPRVAFRPKRDGSFYVSNGYRGVDAEHDIGLHSFGHFGKFIPTFIANRGVIQLRFGREALHTLRHQLRSRRLSIPNEDPEINQKLVGRNLEEFYKVFPELRTLGTRRTWAGRIDATPDLIPIMSRCGFENLILVAGFNGHGFALAPAVGQVISGLILDGIAPLDLDAFRLSRFSEGRLDRQSGAM
jgi:glycine/D-amino acid oxidase-like deaminating enzyme